MSAPTAAGRTDAATPGVVVGRVATRPRTVDEVMAQANLPEALAKLVRDTVRRTRLRRAEKADIARELVSHLQEGLDAGIEPRRLEADFGAPKVVATLLRTAARRRRHPLDRTFGSTLRATGWTVAAIVLIYVASAVVLTVKQPRITFTPSERLNALVPVVADDERAWPLYRAAMMWHAERRRDGSDEPAVGSFVLADEMQAGVESTPEGLAADIAAIRARQAEIAMLRRAAAMPALGRPIAITQDADDRALFGEDEEWDEEYWEIIVPFPHLTELRWAGRLLQADARVAILDGDLERAVDSIVAMLGVARHVGEHPIIISQLVESALIVAAAQETARLVRDAGDRLDDGSLGRLDDAFAAIPESTWRMDLTGERIWFENIVQHIFSDNGRGGGVLLPTPATRMGALLGVAPEDDPNFDALATAVGPLAAIVSAGRRETLEMMDRLYGLVELEQEHPIVNRAHQLDDEVYRMAGSTWMRVRHPLIVLLMPAVSASSNVRTAARNDANAARIGVALERHRRAHGAWPTTLDELVPAILDSVPVDAYDDQPLRYRRTDDGPLLWSVGPDGVDGGGVPAMRRGTVVTRPRFRSDTGDSILIDWRPPMLDPSPAE